MRIESIYNVSRYMAKKACPWSCKVAKVDGGFKCFESSDDYKTWKNQK